MKNYIFFSAIALLMASCSSNSDDSAQETSTLKSVTITATTSMGDNGNTTRAVWQTPSGNNISVLFESDDQLSIFEKGFSGSETFLNSDGGSNYQSANFSGTWHGTAKTDWAAILPAGNGSISMGDNHHNVFTLNLPNVQSTFSTIYNANTATETVSVSPCRTANIMIGAQNTEEDPAVFLAPVCAYVYFATDPATTGVKIVSDDAIAGAFSIVSYKSWNSWQGFLKSLANTTSDDVTSNQDLALSSYSTSSTVKEISITGTQVTRKNTDNSTTTCTEYVACVYPGTHNLTIKTANGTVLGTITLTMYPVHVYALGKID